MKHEVTTGNETWLTPRWVLDELGHFDLDPCSPMTRPWDAADIHYTIEDDGLLMPWDDHRVWLNPPYGRKMRIWMEKMGLHGNGIALVFNRTETKAFQDVIYPSCYSLLHVRGRIRFCDINGNPASSGVAPSVLISYSEKDADILDSCDIDGRHFLMVPKMHLIQIEPKTWKMVVDKVLVGREGMTLNEIYDRVIEEAPKKAARNKHYKAKVRQILQYHFTKIERGKWQA